MFFFLGTASWPWALQANPETVRSFLSWCWGHPLA
jgi:hypothetical protein